MSTAHLLNPPRPVQVRAQGGVPNHIDGRAVDVICESWLVEDRWWTAEPLRRRYWELVGERGRNIVVYHDLRSGRWFAQSA